MVSVLTLHSQLVPCFGRVMFWWSHVYPYLGVYSQTIWWLLSDITLPLQGSTLDDTDLVHSVCVVALFMFMCYCYSAEVILICSCGDSVRVHVLLLQCWSGEKWDFYSHRLPAGAG